MDIDRRFAAATDIAREAGARARHHFANLDALTIESKGLQDQVSEADREVEDLIRARIRERFPDDGLLGEERGLEAGGNSAMWVIDPIDGTACFVAGMPTWCVSIALVVDGKIAAGVIYEPNADEMFAAQRGKGATLGGRPMHVSTSTSIAEGMVGVGFSWRSQPHETLDFLTALLDQHGMYHRNGSGALTLAYVAAGRLLGYFEPHINSWDCLAGICMIEEAGGWACDFLAGDGLMSGNQLLAAAPGVADALRQIAGAGRN